MRTSEICNNYFSTYQKIFTWERNSTKLNVLVSLAVASCFIVIIPLCFKIIQQIDALIGKFKVSKIKKRSQQLANDLDKIFSSAQLNNNQLFNHYRDTESAFINVNLALKHYSKNYNLTESIASQQARGQGATQQPDTVGEVFKVTIDPDRAFIQTIQSIREYQKNNDAALNADKIKLANKGEEIYSFVKDYILVS